MAKFVLALMMAIASLAFAPPALAKGGDRLELNAQSGFGNIPKAKARYEERDRGSRTELRLKVQVERFRPGTTHQIAVNGKVIGKITANQFGRAEVNFRTNSDDRNIQGKSPVIKRGDRITVGTHNAVFR